MDRREFLSKGAAGAATICLAAACAGPKKEDTECRCEGRMPQRKCGEDSVGLLGYGCMRWPMKKGPDGKDMVDQEATNFLVDMALDSGVNYFDSSPVYERGLNERATAVALLRHPRESYFIATKCSNFRDSSYEAGVKMYRESLNNYETDHIDYYLLHSVPNANALKKRFEDNGLLDFLLQERELGHIRKLGFSFHGDKKGFDEMLEKHVEYHWDFVQIQMNYVDWRRTDNPTAEYMYTRLEALGIPVVIMEPLLGGRLSKVPDDMARKMKAREQGRSIASWAFRFCGHFPGVLTVLSGMTCEEHLRDNLDTYMNFKDLSEKDLEFLEEMAGIIKSYPLVGCTGCDYCMPCPYGIDIPGIFRFYNDTVNSGGIVQTTNDRHYRALKKRFLDSYDRTIEKIRQADHCIDCGRCLSKCPQHIRIPDSLRRIDRYADALKQDKL